MVIFWLVSYFFSSFEHLSKVIINKIKPILDISKMQRVKAHNLRKFDDDKLVDELNKFRVSCFAVSSQEWSS